MKNRPWQYTKNQPQNVEAWRIGEACRIAANDPDCGDYIDRGLILLRELENKGYGIVELENLKPTTNPKLNGLYCAVCGEPQFETPHGVCCSNGHGGADSVEKE